MQEISGKDKSENKVIDISKRPLFIGVTGGTAGGKTSICDM